MSALFQKRLGWLPPPGFICIAIECSTCVDGGTTPFNRTLGLCRPCYEKKYGSEKQIRACIRCERQVSIWDLSLGGQCRACCAEATRRDLDRMLQLFPWVKPDDDDGERMSQA